MVKKKSNLQFEFPENIKKGANLSVTRRLAFDDLGDFIEDTTQVSPYDATSKQFLKDNIEEVLAALSPREAQVLRMRFGLSSERAMTLEEVGSRFGVTRERIRQIEAKVLRKLRHTSRSRMLDVFLESSVVRD